MKRKLPTPKTTQRGMGLVEIMVALVIGLVASLVIFQTLRDSGRRATTTTSGGDALTSGALALHYLERDIRQAGWGFTTQDEEAATNLNGAVNCNFGGNWTTPDGTSAAQPLMPLAIRGGALAQNQLLVTYGTSGLYTGAGQFTRTSATKLATQNYYGFADGNRVLLVSEPGGVCELAIAAIDSATPGSLGVTSTTIAKGTIYNLGPRGGSIDDAPQRIEWSVVGTSLQRRRMPAHTDAAWVSNWQNSTFDNQAEIIADGVLEMQVRYRVRGGACQLNPPASPRDIEGVCVGLLVRSKHYSEIEVTTNAPSWVGGAFAATNGGACADSPNCWENYRYEVFEKIIPMRNMIWGSRS
mgnify:CR=1 FL=1